MIQGCPLITEKESQRITPSISRLYYFWLIQLCKRVYVHTLKMQGFVLVLALPVLRPANTSGHTRHRDLIRLFGREQVL